MLFLESELSEAGSKRVGAEATCLMHAHEFGAGEVGLEGVALMAVAGWTKACVIECESVCEGNIEDLDEDLLLDVVDEAEIEGTGGRGVGKVGSLVGDC